MRFAGPVGEWMLEVQGGRALELLRGASSEPLDVLDVGGGHGQLMRYLREDGHRVVVHGSRLAAHARLRDAPGHEDAPRVVSDSWQLPFRDQSFDLVMAIRLLPHVEAWTSLLAEMSRVSARFLLVEFPTQGALHALAPVLFGAKKKLEGNTRPYFDYTPQEIAKALGMADFDTVAIARQFALPMVLHRAVRRPRLSNRIETLLAASGLTRRVGSPILMLSRRRSGHVEETG